MLGFTVGGMPTDCAMATTRTMSAVARGLGLVVLTLCSILPAAAQPVPREADGRTEEVETDRDSFTYATTSAGAGTTILEASYSFIDNRLGPEAHSYPELLVRRGISRRVELRLGFNHEAGGPGTVSGTELGGEDVETEAESRILYGMKVETSQQRGWVPQSALVLQGFTPTSGPSTASTLMVGEAFGWTLPNGWVWDTAIRWGTGYLEAADSFDQWAPSTVLKVPVGERWNVHAEYFGIFSAGKEEPIDGQFFSPGAHVLLTRDLELGIRVGWGLSDRSAAFFANTGLGWRF
jgi:hypothetical protein